MSKDFKEVGKEPGGNLQQEHSGEREQQVRRPGGGRIPVVFEEPLCFGWSRHRVRGSVVPDEVRKEKGVKSFRAIYDILKTLTSFREMKDHWRVLSRGVV